MNTVEVKSAFTELSSVNAKNIIDFKTQQEAKLSQVGASQADDTFQADSRVVAKVLSFSLEKRLSSDSSAHFKDVSNNIRMADKDSNSFFDIDTVVGNVLSFVSTSLASMAKDGASKDKLEYFKTQAQAGVSVGVQQAKDELKDIVNDDFIAKVDEAYSSILEAISRLSSKPGDYSDEVSTSKHQHVEVNSKSGSKLMLSFGGKAFANDTADNDRIFTTQDSNISFSVKDLRAETEELLQTEQLASFINQLDGLLNSFYRNNMEDKFIKASELGYSKAELHSMASQMTHKEFNKATNKYGTIQHYNELTSSEMSSSPKAVAQYVARMMEVTRTSNEILLSEDDYKEIINGLVNQMKDVQVPDLVQAINRFHAFNSQFE
uniref:DUF5610 domain-containing protein n=1 Tax=Ningiella ruwaisensis TaxID=2364274 RepID=UPI0010A09287|nr:DUF5610 domain-containing protein [Ningiella ruwaisensis]